MTLFFFQVLELKAQYHVIVAKQKKTSEFRGILWKFTAWSEDIPPNILKQFLQEEAGI